MKRVGSGISLIAALVALACGEGGGAAGAPNPPSAPAAAANIVAASNVAVGLCSGPGCSYSLDYRNDGRGCGNNVHGKVRAYQDETVLESDDWWLDPTEVINPSETISIEDCCFGPETVRRATRFTSETFWNNVPCS